MANGSGRRRGRAKDGVPRTLHCGGETLEYSVVRSDRRTIAVEVRRDRSVLVRAPRRMREEDITAFVRSRAAWVTRHRERFAREAPPARTYSDGEAYRYLAEEYTLGIERAPRGAVRIEGSRLVVALRGEPSPERVRRALESWERARAAEVFGERLEACWERFARSGEVMPTVRVRAMSSRWGSLSPDGMMSLNVHLLAAPLECVDYVIYHELCHLRVRGHGPGFYREMEASVPDWRDLKRQLAGRGAR